MHPSETGFTGFCSTYPLQSGKLKKDSRTGINRLLKSLPGGLISANWNMVAHVLLPEHTGIFSRSMPWILCSSFQKDLPRSNYFRPWKATFLAKENLWEHITGKGNKKCLIHFSCSFNHRTESILFSPSTLRQCSSLNAGRLTF